MSKLTKAKYDPNEVVTRGILREELDVRFTEEFVSFGKVMKDSFEIVFDRLDSITQELRDFRADYNQFKEKVVSDIDFLIGQFQKFDEELTIQSHRSAVHSDQIEDHESRLQVTERKLDIIPAVAT